jgi:hypothetical protein
MMNYKVIFAFCAGAAVGFAASWKLNEAKFRKIAQEEIDDVKERFTVRKPEPDVKEKEVEPCCIHDEKGEPVEDLTVSEKKRYGMLTDEYLSDEDEKKGGGIMIEKPYVISKDDFGELDGYDVIDLTYYNDDVLAYDIDDEIIDDVEKRVGYDCFKHFGEFDEDTVYVRNDLYQNDYRITCDDRNYSDVVDGVLGDPQDDE